MLLIVSQSMRGQLYINEFLADNQTVLADPDFGDFADWVEIYNAGGTAVNLSGYALSDDSEAFGKWLFPEGTSIPARGFLLVWLDNENSGLHASFRLSKTGESVYLSDRNLALLDSVRFDEQIENVSYGRRVDGSDEWVYFQTPTPGLSNGSGTGDLVAAKPVFSMESGFYDGSQTLVLTPQSARATIYYTLDGSDPGQGSIRYQNPIQLDTTTSVRAMQVEDGFLHSPVATRTYLIDEPTTLPVFSIVTDPDNLWDPDEGIYVEGPDYVWGWGNGNFWQDWEKPCYVEFWESDRELKISQGAALKITGALTRTASQKSLRLIAKGEYGKTKFTYRMFKDKEISSINDIVLRSSGNDWARTMMADGLMQTLVAGQMDIDYQSYRPAILFLNGQYWGIHNIREKVGDDYIEENHGFPKDNIDLLSQTDDIREGDRTQYDALLTYIESHDLNVDEYYDYVSDRIDLQEYVNYYVTQIYYANHDWPAGNIKYWRPRIEPSKWRWILFDTDLAFQQPFLNTMAWVTDPNPEYEIENDLFIGLMKSRRFQQLFLNTYQYHMASTFKTERVLPVIDSLQAAIEPEIRRHIERWRGYHGWTYVYEGEYMKTGYLESYEAWKGYVNQFRTFARNRPDDLNQFVADHFGIGSPTRVIVAVSEPQTGKVWINQDKSTDRSLELVYFTNQELTLEPLVNANSLFSQWVIEQGFYNPGDLVPVIPRLSVWKYLDSGQYPGSGWTETGFDDDEWSEGNGVLGYNYADAATILSYGDDPADKHISYWFRKDFRVSDRSDFQSLQVQLLRDDGALVYLNGQLIVSSNIPADADHTSLALSGVDDSEESRYFIYELPVQSLQTGMNTLAVEVHQVSKTSSDLSFDLALYGTAARAMGERTYSQDERIETIITDRIQYTAEFETSNQPVKLYLNEVMADNLSTVITDYGRTPDWVEIYNPNDYAIDVAGLYITDNLLNPDKFMIPVGQPAYTLVPAGGFIYLIADGDRLYHPGYVNLQFAAEGEEIGLYQQTDNGFVLIDSIFYPALTTDASFGRYPDGADSWHTFSRSATPGKANQINNQEKPDVPLYVLQNYPNPFNDQTTIVFGNKDDLVILLEIRDVHGRLVKKLSHQEWPSGEHELIWDGRDESGTKAASGMYLIVARSGFYVQVKKMIYIR